MHKHKTTAPYPWVDDSAKEIGRIARQGYQEKGRGAVVIVGGPSRPPKEGYPCDYVTTAVLESHDFQEVCDLVGRYDPRSEFVVVIGDPEEEYQWFALHDMPAEGDEEEQDEGQA